VQDVLDSLMPVGTPVPAGLEGACALEGVRAYTSPTDPEVTLLVPADDEPDPEVTLLVPAVNEQITIEAFVAWCHEGLEAAGVKGEILIVDASSDDTPELAVKNGARVLHTPLRGLGRAYIDSVPYVRGRYVIMGDADCTYDFRQLAPFVEAMRAGTEYAMGSRWKGTIEPGAMPALHQYFGTPFTTWILNRLYGSHFSDIHCGMRGITRESLRRMGIVSQSWEYASEMVLKSVRMELKTTEVPVTFFKDREGRLSHHKRSGWFSPFAAAWINLRAMFIHGAEFFLFKPGIFLFALGLLMTLPLSLGDLTVGPVTFSLYTMLIGVALAVIGLQSIYFGCLAHVFLDYGGRHRRRWRRIFRYTKMMVISGSVFTVGLGLVIALVIRFITQDFTLPPAPSPSVHLGIVGLLFMITGFSTFCFTLLLHATSVSYGAAHDSD
jgi:glycosyltransferase involved in cell wall biosynthesis